MRVSPHHTMVNVLHHYHLQSFAQTFPADVTRLSPPPVFEERAWGRGYTSLTIKKWVTSIKFSIYAATNSITSLTEVVIANE